MLKRVPNRFLRNFIERHTKEIRILPSAQQLAQMPRNGFAFAVRVRTKKNFLSSFGGSLQLTDSLNPRLCHLVGRLKLILDINAETLFG